ncbi:MAG: TlpA disulfide reductase family protein [Eubacteriales bacterium]|nr:TlpA disulfide reductase family protein [Eubacteriales bacterium]
MRNRRFFIIMLCIGIICALSLTACGEKQEAAKTEAEIQAEPAAQIEPIEAAPDETAPAEPASADAAPVFKETPYKNEYSDAGVSIAPYGLQFVFNTQTMDGEAFDSKEEFAKNRLTVFTVWSTTCPACIKMMPTWEELSKDYAGTGVEFVGLCLDATVSGGTTADLAKDIVVESGVTYSQILINDALLQQIMQEVMYLPTTFFLDNQGSVIVSPAIGAMDKQVWVDFIETLVSQIA